jgi:hypothetical protein
MRGIIKRWLIIAGVVLAFTLVLALVLPQYVYYTNSRTVFAEAKGVYFAAGVVIKEIRVFDSLSDRDLMLGLSGTYPGDPDNPRSAPRANMSQKLNALLAPDVVFTDEPADGTACVAFTVEDGEITGMIYQTIIGRRLYTVTYEGGDTNITHKKLE